MKLLQGPSLDTVLTAVRYRGPGFDTLRLLAASAVVYHHASARDHDILHDAIFRFSQGYTHLGLLAVSVFFALSGFLVTPGLVRSGDVIAYLSRRIVRIMPLLCVMVVLCAFVVGPLLTHLSLEAYFSDQRTWMYLKNVTTSLSPELPGVVNETGTAKVNTPMWTLRFEWLCYFALAAASLVGLLRHRFAFLAVYVAVQAAMLLGYGFLPAAAKQPHFYIITFLFGYFGAGTLLYLFREWVPVSKPAIAIAAVALLGGLHIGGGHVVAPVLTAYLVTSLGMIRFPWSGWLGKADLSYGIYLSHQVILTILVNIHPFRSGLALFAVGLPLAALFALLTWTMLEKPALRHKDLPARMLLRISLAVWPFRRARNPADSAA